MKFRRYFLGLSSFLISLSSLIISGSFVARPAHAAKQAAKEAAPIGCRASLLMDYASGEVLQEQNSHQAMPPASMVKMMTAYVVLKQLREGSIKADDIVTTSAFASKIGGSQVYLKQGEQFKLSDLLEALLLQSANDAAVALAEFVAGDSSGFVEMMNAEAADLGMKESVFRSPHGLPPAGGQLPDLVSANDLAILGRAIIKEFPDALQYTGKDVATFRDGTFEMRNHNHLVRTFNGCDGLKTGYYSEAGFGVTATAQRNGMRMLSVVMGCETSKIRDAEAARLLSVGFARYRSVKIIEKGAAIDVSVPIVGGEKKQLMLVAADTLSLSVRAGEEKKIEKSINACANLRAPVPMNAACGFIAYLLNGKEIGKVSLVSAEEIKVGGWGSRIKGIFGR